MPTTKITNSNTKQRHFMISLLLLPECECHLWIPFQERDVTIVSIKHANNTSCLTAT